ncbi:MAG: trypsin-like peptidase domain-containing protein, partial [Planctomycetota bacterium]
VVQRLEQERVALAARLAPAVCAVFRGDGGGSGVVITPDGLVLSNYHVTGLETEMRIGLDDHRIHPAVVLGVDPSGDLSLLRLKEKREWSCAPLGDSDALRQGDFVYAMGNPFLLATDFTPTVTFGVVSGVHRYQPGSLRGELLYPDCIQTDASINPGNSGGPLFSFRGEVVGINGRVSLRDRGRVNIGVGYAISSNQIKHCLPELRAGLIVEHGTLNAAVSDLVDPAWPGGIRVTFTQLLAPGCAHGAGITVGEALLAFQGEPVSETNDFLRRISVLPKGRRVALTVARYRDGKWEPRDLRLDLDGVPLVLESAKAQRPAPASYIEQEVARTLAAARAALAPVAGETRMGTLTVRGREPRELVERPGQADPALDEDARFDAQERVDAWNDLVHAGGASRFKSVKFTGGWLAGGRTVDRIEATTPDGRERVYFIDLETGRLLRVDLYARKWVRWISLFLEDWREAGGLLRPFRVEVHDREKESLLQTIVYESITAG